MSTVSGEEEEWEGEEDPDKIPKSCQIFAVFDEESVDCGVVEEHQEDNVGVFEDGGEYHLTLVV